MSGSVLFEKLKITTTGASPVTLVDDFSLEVAEGEVVALIGESGAGKSTIGLSALGYARAGCRFESGKVVLGGADITTLVRDSMRGLRGREVAYVAQSAATAFNPSIRIMDQLVEAALVHRAMSREEAEERALDLSRSMALAEPEQLVRRFPHELSGGQLQRLMTVMALMCRPSLLILDEPTTAIDVTTQLGVLAALKTIIRQERVACLYISHDLAVVAQMADRVVVLKSGKTIEKDTARQIVSNPADAYTKELIAAANPAQRRDAAGPEEAAADGAAPILEVRHVDASYGPNKVAVLRDVSLTIRAGRCIAIIGESGSGKSTLARVITGLLPANRGEIVHGGAVLQPSVKSRTDDQLRRIQLVLQHPDLALNPRITIGDAIGRPLELFLGIKSRAKAKRIASLLDLVELPAEMADRYPSQLSGGQKQRVNLARAIAAEPDLLICDEVTSALDTVVGGHVLQLLSTLREKTGTACIFITHDVSKAAALADEIYVMHRGEVVETGSPATLLAAPRHPYTRTLLRAVPELRTDWLEERMAEAGQRPE